MDKIKTSQFATLAYYCKEPPVPRIYQKVEYLQSSGTQYIATGVYNANGLDITFQSLASQSRGIAAYHQSAGSANNRFGIIQTTEFSGRFLIFSDNSQYAPYYDLNKHSLSFGAYTDWKVYYDNEYKQTFTAQTSSTNYQFLLFGATADGYGKVKIYNCCIYIGTDKQRDYIPCYRKSDSKPGMYDLVTKTFFTNAGTGEFVVGNNV